MSLSGPLSRQSVLCVIAASSRTADAAYINCVTSGVGASYSYGLLYLSTCYEPVK